MSHLANAMLNAHSTMRDHPANQSRLSNDAFSAGCELRPALVASPTSAQISLMEKANGEILNPANERTIESSFDLV